MHGARFQQGMLEVSSGQCFKKPFQGCVCLSLLLHVRWFGSVIHHRHLLPQEGQCNILPKNPLMRPWPPSPHCPHVIIVTTSLCSFKPPLLMLPAYTACLSAPRLRNLFLKHYLELVFDVSNHMIKHFLPIILCPSSFWCSFSLPTLQNCLPKLNPASP